MIELQRRFYREEQIFPLHGGGSAAVCVRVRRRIPDLHRRSFPGIHQFRLQGFVNDPRVRFESGFFFFIVQPFLHGERNEGVLVGEERDLECTFRIVRQFRQKQKDAGCEKKRQQRVNHIEHPCTFQSALRRFDGGVAGKRYIASRIEDQKDADRRSGKESEEEDARQQRSVEQKKSADDEDETVVAGASSHEEGEPGKSDEFEADFIRKLSGPEPVICPEHGSANENELKDKTVVQRKLGIRNPRGKRDWRDEREDQNRNVRVTVLPEHGKSCNRIERAEDRVHRRPFGGGAHVGTVDNPLRAFFPQTPDEIQHCSSTSRRSLRQDARVGESERPRSIRIFAGSRTSGVSGSTYGKFCFGA